MWGDYCQELVYLHGYLYIYHHNVMVVLYEISAKMCN